jgi:hypothetical protein
VIGRLLEVLCRRRAERERRLERSVALHPAGYDGPIYDRERR